MKKLVLLVIALICSFSVFAVNNRVVFNVMPYGLQTFTSSQVDQKSINSGYDFGAELIYQRDFSKFFLEAGMGWNILWLKDYIPSIYNSMMLYGGIGHRITGDKNNIGFVHLDCGMDFCLYNFKKYVALMGRCGFGFEQKISDHVLVRETFDGAFGFIRENNTNYFHYKLLPMIGFVYNF